MNGYEDEFSPCSPSLFRSFVCVVLSLLFGLQVYTHFWSSQDVVDGDFSDLKYVVMQLTRGLSEVHRKHERLQGEIERMSATLPAVAEAAGRAREALEPSSHSASRALHIKDFDRQIADYALESAGARIIDTGETVEHVVYDSHVGWSLYLLSSLFCRGCLGATTMIQPGTLPGECWAFKGSKGEATIRLTGIVHVTAISLEHIPPNISPTREISSAPRLFQLEGLLTLADPYPHDFGTFEYDNRGTPNQYYEVNPSTKGYSLVRLRIFSNWGHSVYTCVYRVRIHGELSTSKHSKDDAEMQIENE